ncbi:MAG: hypothetical protein SVK08_07665, partial [Halobacteriota archaeon]|nr:hypothetical protein [Halobacteriota archaeon]
KKLEVTQLMLNTENPRFDIVGNQREAMQLMLEKQGSKLVKIAKDILLNGLNPTDTPMVAPHKNEKGIYVVLEGNRRIAALKLLVSPELVSEKKKTLQNQFKRLKESAAGNIPTRLECVVFEDPEHANHWIELKHTGENDGVGVVSWDAQQKARFEERTKGKPSLALQALEFLRRSPDVQNDVKNRLDQVPSSSLMRLLSDPDVRKVAGIEISESRLVTNLLPSEIVKPLLKMVVDLLSDEFTVKDIYYKSDRLNYIETFGNKDQPEKKDITSQWELTTPNPPKKPAKKGKRKREKSTKRESVIPTECILHISHRRIDKIYRELKSLPVSEFTNAAAVLLRVFVELSVDRYLEETPGTEANINSKLVKKVQKVAESLVKNMKLTTHDAKPIRVAVSNENSILSISTFNAYVHNKSFTPSEKDLVTTWDNIEPFMKALWESV